MGDHRSTHQGRGHLARWRTAGIRLGGHARFSVRGALRWDVVDDRGLPTDWGNGIVIYIDDSTDLLAPGLWRDKTQGHQTGSSTKS